MTLSREQIQQRFGVWLTAWDEYDIEGVMEFMHEDVVFENWDGIIVSGKMALQKLWTPWFIFNSNFKFITEDIFIDVETQKIAFQWRYEGPTFEKEFKGLRETRRGVDIIYLTYGKICTKYSYSKTGIQINYQSFVLGVYK